MDNRFIPSLSGQVDTKKTMEMRRSYQTAINLEEPVNESDLTLCALLVGNIADATSSYQTTCRFFNALCKYSSSEMVAFINGSFSRIANRARNAKQEIRFPEGLASIISQISHGELNRRRQRTSTIHIKPQAQQERGLMSKKVLYLCYDAFFNTTKPNLFVMFRQFGVCSRQAFFLRIAAPLSQMYRYLRMPGTKGLMQKRSLAHNDEAMPLSKALVDSLAKSHNPSSKALLDGARKPSSQKLIHNVNCLKALVSRGEYSASLCLRMDGNLIIIHNHPRGLIGDEGARFLSVKFPFLAGITIIPKSTTVSAESADLFGREGMSRRAIGRADEIRSMAKYRNRDPLSAAYANVSAPKGRRFSYRFTVY